MIKQYACTSKPKQRELVEARGLEQVGVSSVSGAAGSVESKRHDHAASGRQQKQKHVGFQVFIGDGSALVLGEWCQGLFIIYFFWTIRLKFDLVIEFGLGPVGGLILDSCCWAEMVCKKGFGFGLDGLAGDCMQLHLRTLFDVLALISFTNVGSVQN